MFPPQVPAVQRHPPPGRQPRQRPLHRLRQGGRHQRRVHAVQAAELSRHCEDQQEEGSVQDVQQVLHPAGGEQEWPEQSSLSQHDLLWSEGVRQSPLVRLCGGGQSRGRGILAGVR